MNLKELREDAADTRCSAVEPICLLRPGAKPGKPFPKGGRARWLPQPALKKADYCSLNHVIRMLSMNESNQFLRTLN